MDMNQAIPPAADLDTITKRWADATPGPWFWHGNTDTHTVGLCGRQPGLGVVEVLSTIEVERTRDSRDAKNLLEGLRDAGYSDDQADNALDEWLIDEWGETRTDRRLSITDANYIRHHVNDLAIYEVARYQGLPDDTGRDHPRVYRADVVGVCAPNGEALAHAWSDVHDLIAEVRHWRQQMAFLLHPAGAGRVGCAHPGDDETVCGLVAVAAVAHNEAGDIIPLCATHVGVADPTTLIPLTRLRGER